MKIAERKEVVQNFELGKDEVVDCFSAYLKGKGAVISEKAQFSFDVKIGPTTRDLEIIRITTKVIEETPMNGKIGSL